MKPNSHDHAEIQDDIRVPLHELQADVDYLIGRVLADRSCAPMIAASIKEKLAAIETALTASAQYRSIAHSWLLKAQEHEISARELDAGQDEEIQLHMEAASTLRQCASEIFWPNSVHEEGEDRRSHISQISEADQ